MAPSTYPRRTISLPPEIHERLGSEENASGLIARLLADEFARQDRIAALDEDVQSLDVDGTIYRFKGRWLDAVGDMSYYLHEDGSLVAQWDSDRVPEVIAADEVEDWFSDEDGNVSAPEGVADAFDLTKVVWL